MNMKSLLLILTLCFNLSLFAQETANTQSETLDQQTLIDYVDAEIGKENTCLDDYLQREKQLKKFLIWAPPVAVVGAPAGFMVGGFTAAAVTGLANLEGWSALGYTLMGAFGTGIAVAGTFITLETIKGIEFVRMRTMTNLVVASHNNLFNSKALLRLEKKYNRRYPDDQMNVEDLAATVVTLDETGLLCDGEVRGRINPVKLKHKLARRKDVIRYIHNNINKKVD